MGGGLGGGGGGPGGCVRVGAINFGLMLCGP